jgi:hypothetical protein
MLNSGPSRFTCLSAAWDDSIDYYRPNSVQYRNGHAGRRSLPDRAPRRKRDAESTAGRPFLVSRQKASATTTKG